MAVTSLVLVWLGTVALLATLGLFYQFREPWTGVLVGFAASVLWAFFAVASLSVTVGEGNPPAVEEMTMLVYLGIGFAVLTFLFAVYDLLDTLRADAADADLQSVGEGRT